MSEFNSANLNDFFLLKARHHYVEADQKSININNNIEAPTNVLVIRSYGTDAEWAASAAEQQRKLISGNFHPGQPQIQAPSYSPSIQVEIQTSDSPAPVPSWDPPEWRKKA